MMKLASFRVSLVGFLIGASGVVWSLLSGGNLFATILVWFGFLIILINNSVSIVKEMKRKLNS